MNLARCSFAQRLRSGGWMNEIAPRPVVAPASAAMSGPVTVRIPEFADAEGSHELHAAGPCSRNGYCSA